MKDKTVLVVEDDAVSRRLISTIFSRAGAHVCVAANGQECLRQFEQQKPDLIILDIMMPVMDGYEACVQIRQKSDTPIIMLTALKNDDQIIRGLDSGADDFVSKPASGEVLLARSRAVLRRRGQPVESETENGYRDDYISVNLQSHIVSIRGEPLRLTPTEFRLLGYLMRNAGRVCTFDQILENVWGYEYMGSMDYVHVYTSHLRSKIEPDPKNPTYIKSVHGLGYRFEKPAP
jgi:DNA-binding response OmpR family regulator